MDIYLGFVYACLISLANASQFTTQTPKFQNCGFNMSATCDDVMWLFVDGEQLVGNSSDWRVRSEVHIPANTKVIEIHCLDSWIHGGILASSDNGLITDGAWKCSSDNRKTWKSAFLLGKNGRTAPDISPEAIWIWTDMSHWMQTDHRNHTKAICKIELATSQCPETCPPFNEPVRKTTPIPTTTATIRTTTPSKPKPGFNLTATCDNDMKLFVDGNLKATSSNWRDTSQVIIPENTESIEIHCMTSGIVGGILASSNNGLLTDGAWNCSSDNGATWNPAYEVGPNGGAVSDISPEAEWIWTTGCIGDWTYKYTGKRHKKNVICKIDLKPVIDGGWSALSPFSSCSATCGEATKWQTRTCSNPLPTNGGEACHGSDEVVVSCGLAPCGGHSCPYTDKYKDCPKWKSHCKSGEWTACMNEDCPKTCKCSSCGVTLCSSTEGCPSVKNKLLTTLPQLKKQFLVSFEFLATEFINGWQNVIHFTENGSCCDDGTRVPAVWVSNSGQLYPQFAVNGNGVYGIKTTKKYSLNEWHKVEFSQKLENNKYIYKVIIDGVKQIEVENKQPKIFSNVKVYAADPWFNSLKGSLKNLFINTEGTNKCEGLTLHATCDNNMKIFADTKLLITDNDWKKTSEVKIPENTNTIEIHCYDLHVVGGILASFDNGLKTDGTWSCSANGGSTWNPAYEIGANGMSPWGVRPQISTEAKWIWTGKDTYHGKHKNVICKISLGISTTTATMATTETTARTATTETTATITTAIHGGWSSWSKCSKTCKDGALQTRTCNNPTPAYGGRACSGITSQKCNLHINCPIHGEWSSWSKCSKTCKDGALQTRTCNNPTPAYGGRACSGSTSQNCNQHIYCSIDGGWSSWSKCIKTCKDGALQTRTCNNPTPAYGGRPCSGSTSQKCNQHIYCSIHGGWSSWSKCSKTCKDGALQTRTCNNPIPAYGGRTCSGSTSQKCNQHINCPIHGGWSSWSKCSKTCKDGALQTRTCTNPTPANGGRACSGSTSQTCNQHINCRTYKKMEYSSFCSGSWARITSEVSCRSAAAALNLKWAHSWNGPGDFPGCLHTKDSRNSVYFNTSPKPSNNPNVNANYAEICQVQAAKEGVLITRRPSPSCATVCAGKGLKCDDAAIKAITLETNCYNLLTHFPERTCKKCGPSDSTNKYCFPGAPSGDSFVYFHTSFDPTKGFTCSTTPDKRVDSVCPCSKGLKLQFQLKGVTGQEKVTISIDGNEQEFVLTKEWQAFSYPRPSSGSFSVKFLNDNGPRDVYIRGHESRVADLLPDFASNKGWGCGTENENERCTWLRKGQLAWNGKYTYTLKGQKRRTAFSLRSWRKQKNEKTSNVSSLPGQSGLKLQFQLKGKTGTEKVKVSVDDNEEEYDLKPEWRLFSYPQPSSGSFSVEFLNDIGYTDVFIRGHESQVTDLLPNFPANKFLGCATENEDEKCELLRKGTLMWNGKYTYTLKGQ